MGYEEKTNHKMFRTGNANLVRLVLICGVVRSTYVALCIGDVADVVRLVVRHGEEATGVVIHTDACVESAANDL